MHGQKNKKKQQLNERTTPLVPKKQCGWLYSFAITYKHSNCSVNLQGNHGMAFGRVVKTNKSFYLFLGWSSSFEGSPLSLLACFFTCSFSLGCIFDWSIQGIQKPGLAGMLPRVEVDEKSMGISENLSGPQWRVFFLFFFSWGNRYLSNSIQSNFKTCTHLIITSREGRFL